MASDKYLEYCELDTSSSIYFYIWPTKLGVITFATYATSCSKLLNEVPSSTITPKQCYWVRPHNVPYVCATTYIINLSKFLTNEEQPINTTIQLATVPNTQVRNTQQDIIVSDSQRIQALVIPLPHTNNISFTAGVFLFKPPKNSKADCEILLV